MSWFANLVGDPKAKPGALEKTRNMVVCILWSKGDLKEIRRVGIGIDASIWLRQFRK
jgi:hypothetical protein